MVRSTGSTPVDSQDIPSPAARRTVYGLVFLVPLLPPPTALGWERFLAPVAMTVAISFGFAYLAVRHRFFDPRTSRVPTLATWMTVVLVVYLGRILIEGTWSDLPFFVSRVLIVAALLVLVRWLEVGGVSVEGLLRAYGVGFAVAAFAIVAIGATGWNVFGDLRPSRGWLFSFGKTTGWPRSSGEIGIMMSIAAGALVSFRRSLPPVTRWVGAGLLGMTLLVVQSRNVLLATVVVVVAAVLLARPVPVSIRVLVVIGAMASPFLIQAITPTLETTALGSEIVGERGLRANIYKRYELLDLATGFILDDPVQSVVGHSRDSWNDHTEGVFGEPAAVHNHFLATVINLGLAGAAITIGLLFVHPLWRIARLVPFPDATHGAVFVAGVGTIMSLSFYDGFFSPSLVVVWAALTRLAYPPPDPGVAADPHKGA